MFRPRVFACITLAGGLPTVLYAVVRVGDVTQVTVTTSLRPVLYYHWYIDGEYVGQTSGPSRSFQVPTGDQVRIDCIPTADPDFDPYSVENAPQGFPSRRTIWWCRSVDASVKSYRIDQKEAAGEWVTIAAIAQAAEWDFSILTDRLDDLTEYTWQIVPIDVDGTEGTPTVIGPERIVRTPDAPNFTIEFSETPKTVAFT